MVEVSRNWLDNYVGMLVYGRVEAYVNRGLRYSPSPTNFHVYEIGIDGEVAKPGVTKAGRTYKCRGSEFVRFVMCKIGTPTKRAIDEVERTLGSRVSYAGLKDTNAFTCQFITVKCREGRTYKSEYAILDGSVRLYFYGTEVLPLRRGDLEGNFFEVVVENLTQEDKNKLSRIINDVVAAKPFPNYYGYQRFGSRRPVTHVIGKWVVKGDYRKAVEWLLGHPFPTESLRAQEARRLFDEGHLRVALKKYPHSLRLEALVARNLMKGKSPEASLKSLGRWYINFFVEAYQSYLFNLSLSKALVHEGSVEALSNVCAVLPIPHPALNEKGGCDAYSKEIIREEGISQDLPGVKLMQHGVRDSSFKVINARSFGVDGILILSFALRPSTYATVVLREVFRENLKL